MDELRWKTLCAHYRVSDKSNIYLKGFIFTDLIVLGSYVRDDEQVEVNSIKMNFRQMIAFIENNPFDFYSIKVRDISSSFSIAESLENTNEILGFAVFEKALFLSKVSISASVPGLVGFQFVNQLPVVSISQHDLTQTFQERSDLFRAVDDYQLKILIHSIGKSKSLSRTQKEYFRRFLNIQKIVPNSLAHKIKDFKAA